MTTTFCEYLSVLGDAAASELLGYKKSRIKSWRLGKRQPRPAEVHQILERTKGRMGWADIYPDRREAVSE